MARKSSAALSVVVGNLGQRPEPPDDLTAEQAEIWRATVASEAADFFRTSALRELLRDYCCHRALAASLTREIDQIPVKAVLHAEHAKTFERACRMREKETKAAGDKATKLRLTNQSRYTPQAAATASKNASMITKPWDWTSDGA